MIAKAILISSNHALADKIKRALTDDAALVVANPLRDNVKEVAEQFNPDAIIIDSDTRNGTGTAFERFTEIKRLFPGQKIIVLGNESGAQLILMAMRAGASDFIDQDASDQEIRNVVMRQVKTGRLSDRNSPSQLVAVLSAQPCDENHDLAVNIGVAVAHARSRESVVLIDLSLPDAGLNVALNLDIGFCIPDAIKEMARLDRTFLDSALTRCENSGLYLLPLASDETILPTIDTQDIIALIEIVKGLYDVVILYYGPFSRHEALLRLTPESSLVILGCNQRFTSVKATNDLSDRICRLQAHLQPVIAIHELAPGMSPSHDEISAVLGRQKTISLPASWPELTESANRASPLALRPHSPYRQALKDCLLEHHLLPIKTEHKFASRSLWRRARSAMAQFQAGGS